MAEQSIYRRRRFFALGLAVAAIILAVILRWPGTSHTPTPKPGNAVDTESLKAEATAGDSREDAFEEITADSGVNSVYRTGRESNDFTILESLGGGVAMWDFDRDGDLDLLFANGGRISIKPPSVHGLPAALFQNAGDGRYQDCSTPAYVSQTSQYAHGCAVADFNSDGLPDICLCGYDSLRLFRNLGDGTFFECAKECGIAGNGWNTAAAWGDFDNDGFADLYVARYLQWTPGDARRCEGRRGIRDVCSPRRYKPANDRLLRNRGDGTFEDVSRRAGLRPGGNGLGVVAADYNADGWIDYYVANDETDNFLYLGGPDGRLREVAAGSGVATNEYGMHDGSMGIDVGDFDADGRMDIWITNFEAEDNVMYRNLGDDQFTSATVILGLAGRSRSFVGFGTAMADFDGDTWPDLFVSNGHVFYRSGQRPYAQPAQLFRNLKGRRFLEYSKSGGPYFRKPHVGRGTAVGDLNNDGALDLVITHQNTPAAILRNRKTPIRYARAELRGVKCNPDAIGASLKWVHNGRTVTRYVSSGNGYFSHFDKRLILPRNSDAPFEVVVQWPGGKPERFRMLATHVNQCLIQGHGEPDDEQ